MRKLLDAAAAEFGEKGFHDASISGITRRAGTALGSFYTYFESKEALFQALVRDMSVRVKQNAAQGVAQLGEGSHPALAVEEAAFTAFLGFVRDHKEIYRIIDESEFVDPQSYRRHYESTAQRILERLTHGAQAGEFRGDLDEAHAWAIMGMNVFLGLRFAVWSDDRPVDEIAAIARSVLTRGIARSGAQD